MKTYGYIQFPDKSVTYANGSKEVIVGKPIYGYCRGNLISNPASIIFEDNYGIVRVVGKQFFYS